MKGQVILLKKKKKRNSEDTSDVKNKMTFFKKMICVRQVLGYVGGEIVIQMQIILLLNQLLLPLFSLIFPFGPHH